MHSLQTEIWRTSIRVSHVGSRGKEGGTQLLSPDDQLARGREYAERHHGMHDDAVSLSNADLDQSGFTKLYTQRPGIMRHLADAKAGKFQHLVFAFTERSSRDIVDGILLYRDFTEAGVKVHYLDLGSEPGDENYEEMRDLNLWLGSLYSRRLSRRLKRIMASRALLRKIQGAPPGWIQKSSTDPTGYEINPVNAIPILRMVELRCEGAGRGLRWITEKLNEEGLRTAKNCTWELGTVKRHLTEHYIRKMLGDASYTPGSVKKNGSTTTDETIWIVGAYPAIIDSETAARLRLIAADLKTVPGSGVPHVRGASPDSRYLCAGRIRCGACGAPMTTHKLSTPTAAIKWPAATPDQLRQYRCSKPVTLKEEHKRLGNTIIASQVEEAVDRLIRVAIKLPGPAPQKQRPRLSTPRPVRTAEQIDEDIDRLLQMHLSGSLPLPDYERNVRRFIKEREYLSDGSGSVGVLANAQPMPAIVPAPGESLLRATILRLVSRIDACVELPANVKVVEATEDQDTAKRRRFIRVTLRFDTNLGNVFYAGLYRPAWARPRPIFYTGVDSDLCV